MRIPALLLVCLAGLLPVTAAEPFKISVQLDWVPEPEHGGFYQAQAKGFFREEGLEVELRPGGPNAFVLPSVATGKADVGQADSTNTLLQQAEGVPVVQFAAVFQDDPSGILVHADSSVREFKDLNGKTIIARPEWAFLKYLQRTYDLSFNVVPQNFSVAAFLGNREALQQGYYIAEPFHIEKAGGKPPRFLSTWEAGFRAYAVLITSRRFAREHPAELARFVRAYVRGWKDYLEGDPTPAHAAMKAANPINTDDFMAYSRKMIIEGELVTGRMAGGPPAVQKTPGSPATRDRDGSAGMIGRLDPKRFAEQIRQLEELGILKKGKVTPESAVLQLGAAVTPGTAPIR